MSARCSQCSRRFTRVWSVRSVQLCEVCIGRLHEVAHWVPQSVRNQLGIWGRRRAYANIAPVLTLGAAMGWLNKAWMGVADTFRRAVGKRNVPSARNYAARRV